MADGSRSFTIPAAPLETGSTPTRIRISKKTENREVGELRRLSREKLDAGDGDGGGDGAELTAAEAKRRKKETVRKKNVDLSRAKAEISQACGTVNSLIHSIQQTSLAPSLVSDERRDSLDTLRSDSLTSGVHLLDQGDSQVAGSVGSDGDDLLLSMVTLAKLTKKLALQRDQLEGTCAQQRRHIVSIEAKNEELFAELEQLARKLKEEKANSSTARTELEMMYRDRLASAAKEVELLRAQMAALREQSRDLGEELEDRETKLLEVPRLEESYLRTARGLVRAKERLLNEKEVKIRSMQQEVEQVAFWKTKAAVCNEESLRKDKELAELKRQSLIIAHNFRQVTSTNQKLTQQLMAVSKRVPLDTQRRPASPSPPPSPPSHSDAYDIMDELQRLAREELPSQGLTLAAAQEERKQQPHQSQQSRQAASLPTLRPATATSSRKPAATHATTHATTHASAHRPSADEEDFNSKEVRRLRGVVSELGETIKALHFKLAQARAYPLMHTEVPGGGGSGGDDDGRDNRFVGKVYVSEMDELFDPGQDDEEADAVAQREAKEASAARIARALSVQRDFVSRIDEIRGKRPKSAHFLGKDKVTASMRR